MIECPYSGRVEPRKVKEVSRALLDMGCYEISLGDTVGMGTPATVTTMLETVMGGDRGLPVSRLAVSSRKHRSTRKFTNIIHFVSCANVIRFISTIRMALVS